MEFIYFSFKKKIEWANDLKRKITLFGASFLFPFLKILDKKLIRNTLIISNSEFTKKEIHERYIKNSFISYPPLDNIFKPQVSKKNLEKYGIQKKFLFTAGRIIPDKKTDWLIKIFSGIKEDHEFVIAGGIEEKYKKLLEKLAEELGVRDKIKFLGVIDQKDLINLYSNCEVFLFASPKEAFGLAPIEALACGAPIIAWNDFAGPNEYVIKGVNGFLAKPYNLNDFKKKVYKCLNTNFKMKNRKKIISSVDKFREENQYKKFIEIIENY
jgi:glycosyltransferase involved in cell wall biosynthesis